MTSRLRTFFILLACSLLAGCGLRFAYQQLDRLVPWYVSDYVTLDDAQREALDTLLAPRLAWHCQTQLPVYRDWLERVSDTLDQALVSAAELAPLGAEAEALWRTLGLALVPDLTPLLATLSDAQVNEILRALDQKNRELRREHLDISLEEQLAKRIKRMEKQLGRWTGRLNAEQHAAVTAWAKNVRPTTAEWIAQRKAWRQRLGDALAVRTDPTRLEAQLRPLLANPDAHWPAAHRADVEFNRSLTLQLIAEVHTLSPTAQRAHIANEIESVRNQIDQLACAAPSPLAALQ